jgi:dihydropteroate synthase
MYSDFLQNKFEINARQTDVDRAAYCFGIINLTPDSFSDGSSHYSTVDYQLHKVNEHIGLKADVIDIGAESTKPNAVAVSAREEYERLAPFLEIYDSELPLSLDTRNPEIIKKVFSQKSLSEKIKFVNNISGMQDTAFIEECSKSCPLEMKYIAMHAKGAIPPRIAARDLDDAFYDEDGGLEDHMFKFFQKTIEVCDQYGIKEEQLILDPGFGFAKNFSQSFELINIISKLKKEFGLPIFVGSSRKSFLRLWADKISELGFNADNLTNYELDLLTVEFNNLLTDVDYFRMHA